MKREYFLYDFENFEGKVEAYRHINPDGSKGGIVAKTAKVDDTVHLGSGVKVYDYAEVLDNAKVFDRVKVFGYAKVYGKAKIHGGARISGKAQVFEQAIINDESDILYYAKVYGNARIFDSVLVSGFAKVFGNAVLGGRVQVYGESKVYGCAYINDQVILTDKASIRTNINITNKQIEINRALTKSVIFIQHPVCSITVMDRYIKAGCETKTFKEWLEYDDQKVIDEFGEMYLECWELIKTLAKNRG